MGIDAIRAVRRLALAGALSAVAATAGAQPADGAPIKIGFLAELSGPVAAIGQDMVDGFMLVVERNGGRLGGVPVQVIRKDSQQKPEVAAQLADELLDRERVAVVAGITFSNVMMAAYRKIVDREVVLVGTNAGPSPIAGAQCSPFFFSTSYQNDQQAEVLGQYANERGFARVAVIAPNYQAGKDAVAGFKRYFKGRFPVELYPAVNQPDLSAELAQIAASDAQAVFAFMPGGIGINFVKQFGQAGLRARLPLMTVSTVDQIGLAGMGPAAAGVIAGAPWGPDLRNAANDAFVKEFEARYRRIPSQYAAQSYDGAQLLDAALAKVGGNVADRKALLAALRAAEFKSVRGEFKFNRNQFPIQDLHVFEAAPDASGRMTLKRVATPLKADGDAYAEKCPLPAAT